MGEWGISGGRGWGDGPKTYRQGTGCGNGPRLLRGKVLHSGAQARFTSPDAPFNDQDQSNPQSWNLYSYGRNNPLTFIDPNGTTTCDANGNNCHDDVTVNGDSGPVDYAWSFLQSAGSQAVQNAVNATNTALTAINNFRSNSNCAAALTTFGGAADWG